MPMAETLPASLLRGRYQGWWVALYLADDLSLSLVHRF